MQLRRVAAKVPSDLEEVRQRNVATREAEQVKLQQERAACAAQAAKLQAATAVVGKRQRTPSHKLFLSGYTDMSTNSFCKSMRCCLYQKQNRLCGFASVDSRLLCPCGRCLLVLTALSVSHAEVVFRLCHTLRKGMLFEIADEIYSKTSLEQ